MWNEILKSWFASYQREKYSALNRRFSQASQEAKLSHVRFHRGYVCRKYCCYKSIILSRSRCKSGFNATGHAKSVIYFRPLRGPYNGENNENYLLLLYKSRIHMKNFRFWLMNRFLEEGFSYLAYDPQLFNHPRQNKLVLLIVDLFDILFYHWRLA